MVGTILKLTLMVLTCCFMYPTIKTQSIESKFKMAYISTITDCTKDYTITENDWSKLKRQEIPDNVDVRCILACILKRGGVMDSFGKFSPTGTRRLAERYLAEDNFKMNIVHHFVEACQSVNDVQVSDGDVGCERAALLFKCNAEKTPEFNFSVDDNEVKFPKS